MTTTQKRKTLMHLAAQYQHYLTAEAKLREAIIAARSSSLDGEPMCTFKEISRELGITPQAVQQYTKRWGGKSA